jgi:hypothetical protein
MFKGERNEACPKIYAERLASQLSNAEGGAVIYTVKGLSSTPHEVTFTNFQLRRCRDAYHYSRTRLDCEPGFCEIYFPTST